MDSAGGLEEQGSSGRAHQSSTPSVGRLKGPKTEGGAFNRVRRFHFAIGTRRRHGSIVFRTGANYPIGEGIGWEAECSFQERGSVAMNVLPFRRHKPRREHDRGVGYTAIIFVEAISKDPFADLRLRDRVPRPYLGSASPDLKTLDCRGCLRYLMSRIRRRYLRSRLSLV